jgi:hypothetical protein
MRCLLMLLGLHVRLFVLLHLFVLLRLCTLLGLFVLLRLRMLLRLCTLLGLFVLLRLLMLLHPVTRRRVGQVPIGSTQGRSLVVEVLLLILTHRRCGCRVMVVQAWARMVEVAGARSGQDLRPSVILRYMHRGHAGRTLLMLKLQRGRGAVVCTHGVAATANHPVHH